MANPFAVFAVFYPPRRWILRRISMTQAHDRFALIALLVLFCIAELIVMSVLGAIGAAFVQLLRERRESRPPPWKMCRGCGYNLIASRKQCPECGLPIPPWPVERPRIRIYRGFVLVESGRGRDEKRNDFLDRFLRSVARRLRRWPADAARSAARLIFQSRNTSENVEVSARWWSKR
jgi:hypothetical protein